MPRFQRPARRAAALTEGVGAGSCASQTARRLLASEGRALHRAEPLKRDSEQQPRKRREAACEQGHGQLRQRVRRGGRSGLAEARRRSGLQRLRRGRRSAQLRQQQQQQ